MSDVRWMFDAETIGALVSATDHVAGLLDERVVRSVSVAGIAAAVRCAAVVEGGKLAPMSEATARCWRLFPAGEWVVMMGALACLYGGDNEETRVKQ